jgi:hypothetical protein
MVITEDKIAQPFFFLKMHKNMCEIMSTFELFFSTELVQIIVEESNT